jgi:AraC-like DNA-binding protein
MEITKKYPGIDNLKTKLISRSVDKTRRESLGLGFMHKPGVTVDELDFRLKKYALIYVIRGKGEYVDMHGNKYPLSAGSIFQRHPEVMHSTLIDSESAWAECFIDFGTNLYNSLVAYNLIRDDHFVYQISPDKTIESECYELMVRLENCSEAELPFLASDMISFLAGIIQRCTTVSEGEMDRVIDKSCIFFSKNPAKRIELKKYCKTHGLGYESFRKAFRQKIGISPGQYIVKRRMDTACQMLRISRKPINGIASELGYSSQYEFSAQFKKNIGISPKAYRG